MSLFITIDGADGTGKTEIATELAKRLQGAYFKYPSKLFKSFCSKVFNEASPLTSYFAYRAAAQHDSDSIKTLLNKGKTVIADRYINSARAYLAVKDEEVENIHQTDNLAKADLEILLTADTKTRFNRVAKRHDPPIKEHERDLALQDKVQNKFKSYNMLEINTNSTTVKEATDLIIEKIFELNLIKKNIYKKAIKPSI